MRIKSILKLCAAGLVWVCIAGCDMGYSPMIVNEYDEPIELSLTFNGGEIRQTATLPPHTPLVQRQKGLAIYEILLKTASGGVRKYSLPDFEAARRKRPSDL